MSVFSLNGMGVEQTTPRSSSFFECQQVAQIANIIGIQNKGGWVI